MLLKYVKVLVVNEAEGKDTAGTKAGRNEGRKMNGWNNG
jgi:hypothetical protein